MDDNNWNLPRCSGNVSQTLSTLVNSDLLLFKRPKRADPSRPGGGSPRSRSARITPINITRSPTYIDDVTLNAMITSGMMESLGPVNFAQVKSKLLCICLPSPSSFVAFGSITSTSEIPS